MRQGPLPTQLLAMVVRQRARSHTLTRVSRERASMGQSARTTSTVTADMWVGPPRDVEAQVASGERLDGDLSAVTLPSEDVQQTDELTYGGVKYSVQEVVGGPDRDNPDVVLISLDKVTNS